ncbi:MAG: tetratricopeptide repeat protein [Alphaproteobacteria bacterium]|nr:tetratricopeptide repeat protein [Alphaproteobacteria bacterium]
MVDDDLLGHALASHRDGAYGEAEVLYLRLLDKDPGDVQALYLLGLLWHQLERHEDALTRLGRAMILVPAQVEIQCHIGEVFRALGRLDEAEGAYRRAVALVPTEAKAHYGLGLALKELARLPESRMRLRAAVALDPAEPRFRMVLGRMEQLFGNVTVGFALCEARLEMPAYREQLRLLPASPLWTGGPVDTLLLLAEGGLGDILQLSRYVPSLKTRCRRLLLACPSGLLHLMAQLPGWEPWDGETPDAIAPLLSVPWRFGHDQHAFPGDVPYFRADPERVAHWSAALARQPGETLIGVAWKVGPETWIEGEAGRSFDPMHLAVIGRLPGVRLIVLQKGQPIPPELGAQDLGPEFDAGPDAFRDTAAVMECLDLVITPDTSLGHLAGALARPVWVAMKVVPECRWMLGFEGSRWYPTIRLFRQSAPGDWAPVFAAMVDQIMPWLRNDQ